MNPITSKKNKLGFVGDGYMGCPIAHRFSKSGFNAAAHDLDRMIEIKRLGCILLLIGIAGLMGYSQEKANEYVSPSEAVLMGKAPKMQVQLLNPGEPTKQYAVIFYQVRRGFFRTVGVCGQVSHYECTFQCYWSTEWSNVGVV